MKTQKEKTVLVTGGSRGIGKSIAQAFAEQGYQVIVHYNQNNQAARQVLENLKAGNHMIIQADLKNPEEILSMVNKCYQHYPEINVLINNAGVYLEKEIISLNYSSWQKFWNETIATNLSGPAHLSFLISMAMKDHGGGKIINISSRGAFRGEPNAPAYGASKAGMNSFGQSFAKALAPHHIFVYTLAPGFVDTDMGVHAMQGEKGDAIRKQSPLNRIAHPDEIAQTALFLADKDNEYLTGCIIDINGASYLRT